MAALKIFLEIKKAGHNSVTDEQAKILANNPSITQAFIAISVHDPVYAEVMADYSS